MDFEDKEDEKPVHCIIVGDSDVGKTVSLHTFVTKKYPNEYTSRSFSDLEVDVDLDARKLRMLLRDSSGRRDFAQFRKLVYPNTDVVILCFAINSPESMNNIRTYWHPEVKRECPDRPLVLAGAKSDLRDSICDAARIVSSRNGQALAQEIDAVAYFEFSSLTGANIEVLFQSAASAGLEFAHTRALKKRASCCVT